MPAARHTESVGRLADTMAAAMALVSAVASARRGRHRLPVGARRPAPLSGNTPAGPPLDERGSR
ncbi:hypothetical protein ACH4ND_17900 [Streptomyces sp. NPDC017179]|uniref:hypothetical protein n=1 Tax=Streptomyces sp. NPDC017179 TaxID=3364979 RepID=UPI00378CD9CE